MAARANKGTASQPWDESVREKIRTSMLVNRVIDHAFGKIEMTAEQARSAYKLIDKVLPDLKALELSGGTNNTMTINVNIGGDDNS